MGYGNLTLGFAFGTAFLKQYVGEKYISPHFFMGEIKTDVL